MSGFSETKPRRNILDLSPSQRKDLSLWIRSFVNDEFLSKHYQWHGIHGIGGDLNTPSSGIQFLAFHKKMVQELEQFLLSKHKKEYVPLPFWDPSTPIPPEFFHATRDSNNPNKPLPSWATIKGGDEDPIFHNRSLREFKSSDQLGKALAFYHSSVHGAIGGTMNTFQSPKDSIFFPWHAFLDNVWASWQSLHPEVIETIDLDVVDSHHDNHLQNDSHHDNHHPNEAHPHPIPIIEKPVEGEKISESLFISGTCVPNCIVEVFDGISPIGKTKSDKAGKWSLSTRILVSGSHSIKARCKDENGETSELSKPVNVIRSDIIPSKCFIATAAYGSELSPQVQFLRNFRDNIILKSKYKGTFEEILDVYYKFSPSIAEKMRRSKLFKHVMKYLIVWPFIAILKISVLLFRLFSRSKRE